MKNTFNQSSVALLSLLALGVALGANATAQVNSVTAGPSTDIQWRFDSGANIAAPEVGAGSSGIQAVVAPGAHSARWLAGNPYFGTVTGIWDLGSRGTIAVGNLNSMLGDSNVGRTFKVRVVQWVDGGIYTAPVEVSVPGAVMTKQDQFPVASLGDGVAGDAGWVVEETEWSASAGSSLSTLTVTGAYDGSVIDSLELQRSVPSLADLVLNIQPVDGGFELSWPEAAGNATVESTADLSDPTSWTTFPTAPEISNGRYKVATGSAGGVRYFRLKR